MFTRFARSINYILNKKTGSPELITQSNGNSAIKVWNEIKILFSHLLSWKIKPALIRGFASALSNI